MRDEICLREWQQNYREGKYEGKDCSTMIKAGWYDWFCGDKSLYSRFKKMSGTINAIKDGGKVNLDNTYVFFKNNCPMVGRLYDSAKICDIESGDVIYCINFNDERETTPIVVYGFNGIGQEWENPVATFESKKDLQNWLNVGWGF